ncbi:MAG: aspartate--tRNA ligase [Bacteroidetes bacterium]|nr:MAG: aspartate--tRNA ligase [Bacteroidota bacterium]
MYRTHTCGELRAEHVGKEVTLSGWVQRRRDLGGMSFIDLRDRYGITQLAFNDGVDATLLEKARKVNREFVIQATGKVIARESVNKHNPTGDVEVVVTDLKVLNAAKTPPFTIENETDGGEELRMKYRYLDIRRNPVRDNLMLRHRVSMAVRKYLSDAGFIDVETPYLIKSTPEGARDFVVPSRMNPNEFYALPQSPQTFKQLLMVAGMDRYYQIVRCFRDEDLRADRQPEFTQIDCEMAFVEQEDIISMFEGLIKSLLKEVRGVEIDEVPRMSWHEAMERYGNDKPDIRFGMELLKMNDLVQGKGFKVFDDSELVVGIKVDGAADWTRKQLDALTKWVQRPQIGMGGVIWAKYGEDGSRSSSVNKFFDEAAQAEWAEAFGAKPGDLMLILAGAETKTRKAMSELRLYMGEELGLRNPDVFAPLWVTDFPLLEWDEDTERFYAMHHPFTSPKPEDMDKIDTAPGEVRANAYDMVLNGNEIGGGSIRIHDRDLQKRMFTLLGFSDEEAQEQFGFLMNAFEYGAPPHGGIAFGFDRLCALIGGDEVIRDYIAFPKNNAGRDVMIDAPAAISGEQLDELYLGLKPLD